MTSPPAPPRIAERLLSTLVRDPEWRDSILGDLREEYAGILASHGSAAARRWYWRHAGAVAARSMTARFRGNRSRTWTAPDVSESAGWRAGLTRDVRYAWRTVASRPGLSAVIVLTFGLALAANSTIFALIDALVLRPFRFPGVERLVVVASSTREPLFDRESVANADFRDWRRESRTVTQLSAMEWWDANLSAVDEPEQVAGFRVTAEFFDALGVKPTIGRAFTREEETPGQHRRVVLGHALWARRFAADPAIVGRTVRFDGEPYEVVGIAPPGFAIPLGAQVWSPLALAPEAWENRRGTFLTVIGRLADGATLEDARGEFGSIARQLAREYPDTNASRPLTVVDFTTGMGDPGAGRFLATWQTAALLLLLIACANVANLLLTRGAERSNEFAIRLALGASRSRLASQTLIEGSMLALLATIAAIPLAWAGLALSRASIPPSVIRFVPGWAYIGLSPWLVAVTAVLAAFAMVVFSLVPALQAARCGISDTLRHMGRSFTSSRQRQWTRNVLGMAQVALTLALLFGSALLLSASDRAMNGALGFDKHNLLIARVSLPERAYADPERRRIFADTVLNRMRAIPAVTAVAMTSHLPYGGSNSRRDFWPEGVQLQRSEVRQADFRRVTTDYFDAMRIPLVTGRRFTADDRAGTQPVAIVSRSLVERYWPRQEVVGRRFKLSEDGPWITVVGVVGDVWHDWVLERSNSTVYRPVAQDAPYGHAFVVRTVGDPTSIAGDLRRAIASADPDQPIADLETMEAQMSDRIAGLRFISNAVGVMGLIALVLAITGVYSFMSYMASRRTQEIGIRVALGAGRWQVIRLTTRQALVVALIGVVSGTAISIALGRTMEAILLGAVANSVVQLATIAITLLAVAMLAAYLPARRAAAIDPTAALRAD